MRDFRFVFGLSLVAGLTFSSCLSSSTGPNSGSETLQTPPGVGSIFVYHQWYIDTSGMIAGSERYDTMTIIATGISFAGKHNVTQIVLATDTGYLNYESNGDISMYRGSDGYPGGRSGWLTVPLSSKSTQSFTYIDSVDFGNGVHHVSTESSSYTGAQNIVLAGHTFNAKTTRYVVTEDALIYDNETDWFDSQTGICIKIDMPPIRPNGTSFDDGAQWVLVSYNLK